ncbi:hypothetical protein EVAR_100988_1 [Eumeta japonica]|uniref:Uncharacterized protein n=1 Tax=Eumeta variegata TaxID=151549 RepID=A0A4C1SRU0_EUMVA|nr:hypothetical protein EVAR_100988_1 [Eumeta japonica]
MKRPALQACSRSVRRRRRPAGSESSAIDSGSFVSITAALPTPRPAATVGMTFEVVMDHKTLCCSKESNEVKYRISAVQDFGD